MSPGSYRFQVQASSDEGIWHHAGAEIAFTVTPLFYLTVCFERRMHPRHGGSGPDGEGMALVAYATTA